MGLLNQAAKSLLANFIEITEPEFMKEFTKENQQLNDLLMLSKKLKDGDKRELIERDIVYLKAGIAGEQKVDYELKNSFLPFICLHDIRLEYKDHVAQFDFIIITNKFICVLETKKLFGNITINRDGDFIRTIRGSNGRTYKEGMYSPISQNERHLRILKEMLTNEGMIRFMPLKSLVVMANEKTIIDKKGCPAYISKALYKHDQIVPYLKRNLNDKKNEMDVHPKNMVKIARFLIENDKPITYDYKAKYSIEDADYLEEGVREVGRDYMEVAKEEVQPQDVVKDEVQPHEIEKKEIQLYEEDKERLRSELKAYRLRKSREEQVKAYYIFNNKEMEALIMKDPKCEEDMLCVAGFGKIKVEKYGKDILDIFSKS